MYDIIGDVHGCYTELLQLLEKLGYRHNKGLYKHPQQRKMVFVGDLTDRGPASIKVMEFVATHVKHKEAFYVPGNHCDKLYRYFLGRHVQIKHGLETTVEEYERLTSSRKSEVKKAFMHLVDQSPYYLRLDNDQLIVSHAGIRQNDIGKSVKKHKQVKTFCLYGEITGKKDENGVPIRGDWAQKYTGKRWIVYGHTPVKQPRIVNRTVNIDTGCVFGGHLTGLQYPEMTFEQVASTLPYIAEKFRY